MNKLQLLMQEYNEVNARICTVQEQPTDLALVREFQAETLPATLNSIVEAQTKGAKLIASNLDIIEQHFDGSDDITDEEYFSAVSSLDTELDKLGLNTELISNLVCAAVATAIGELQLGRLTEKSS